MCEDELKTRVNELVARKTHLPAAELTPEKRLFHDLHVWGDDAGELLSEFAAKFGVSPAGFRFERYFPGEPHLFNWFPRWRAKRRVLPFRMEDLYRSAAAKQFVTGD